jgi:hypothetical protein
VANSQNPQSFVKVSRINPGVPAGVGQFATSVNIRVTSRKVVMDERDQYLSFVFQLLTKLRVHLTTDPDIER